MLTEEQQDVLMLTEALNSSAKVEKTLTDQAKKNVLYFSRFTVGGETYVVKFQNAWYGGSKIGRNAYLVSLHSTKVSGSGLTLRKGTPKMHGNAKEVVAATVKAIEQFYSTKRPEGIIYRLAMGTSRAKTLLRRAHKASRLKTVTDLYTLDFEGVHQFIAMAVRKNKTPGQVFSTLKQKVEKDGVNWEAMVIAATEGKTSEEVEQVASDVAALKTPSDMKTYKIPAGEVFRHTYNNPISEKFRKETPASHTVGLDDYYGQKFEERLTERLGDMVNGKTSEDKKDQAVADILNTILSNEPFSGRQNVASVDDLNSWNSKFWDAERAIHRVYDNFGSKTIGLVLMKELSTHERGAISAYCSKSHRDMNRFLTGRDASGDTSKIERKIKALDRAFKKASMRLPESLTVFRGMKSPINRTIDMVEKGYYLTTTYASTALKPSVGWSFSNFRPPKIEHVAVSKTNAPASDLKKDINAYGIADNLSYIPTLMQIRGLNNTASLYPDGLSSYQTETEIILNRDITLKIDRLDYMVWRDDGAYNMAISLGMTILDADAQIVESSGKSFRSLISEAPDEDYGGIGLEGVVNVLNFTGDQDDGEEDEHSPDADEKFRGDM